MSNGFGQILQGALNEAEKRRESNRQLQQVLQQLQLQQRFKQQAAQQQQQQQQQDPLRQLLKFGQIGGALKNLGLNFGDIGVQQPSVGGAQQRPFNLGGATQPAVTPNRRIANIPTRRSPGIVIPEERPDTFAKEFKVEENLFGGIKIQPEKLISQQGLIQEKIIGEATKATGKQLQTLVKTSGNLSRVRAAFEGIVARGKQAVNEQGGFGAKQAIGVRAKRFGQRLGVGGEIPLEEQISGLTGFEAQTQEVILALAPILTGQNRILRSALAMIKKTVPQLPITGTTEAEFTANLEQSLKNSFKLSLAIGKGLLPPEKIVELTQNSSDKEITDFLTGLVEKTKFTRNDEIFFRNFFQDVLKTPASTPKALFAPGEATFRTSPRGQAVNQQNIQRKIDQIDAQLRRLGGQ